MYFKHFCYFRIYDDVLLYSIPLYTFQTLYVMINSFSFSCAFSVFSAPVQNKTESVKLYMNRIETNIVHAANDCWCLTKTKEIKKYKNFFLTSMSMETHITSYVWCIYISHFASFQFNLKFRRVKTRLWIEKLLNLLYIARVSCRAIM